MPTVAYMFDMTGKAAIVTGGATHLGRAMATALCELGASVTIASRRAALCEQVAAQLQDEDYDCVGAGCDVTSEQEVDALVDGVTARTGRLDVMVCNAGGSGDLPSTYVPNSSVEEFMNTIDINLKGAYLCAQAAARVMVKQRSGSIITIGSIHGFTTSDKRFYDGLDMRRGGVAYQTSKGGVIQLTRNLAGELGEYGVTANCISPGQIPHARRERRDRREVPPKPANPPHRRPRRPQGRRRPASLPRRRMDHRPQPRSRRRLDHLVRGVVP